MLITNIRALKPELLTAIFRANEVISETEAVKQIRTVSSGESNSSQYYSLAIQYKDYQTQRHAPDRVWLKLTKPELPYTANEVKFYKQVLPLMLKRYTPQELCIPACYDAFYDSEAEKSHLILADATQEHKRSPETTPPTPRHREQVMDALARIHAFWWEHDRLALLAPIPDETIIEGWLNKAQTGYAKLLEFNAAQVSPSRRLIFEQVSKGLPPRRYANLIAGKRLTIIHRDLHPNNMLYSHKDALIVDWQSWRVDAGTDDLAYMIAGFYAPQMRKFEETKLLRRYHETLLKSGVADYSWEDLLDDYKASIARCLVFLLSGWSREKHMKGYWKTAESLLSAFEELDGLAIFKG